MSDLSGISGLSGLSGLSGEELAASARQLEVDAEIQRLAKLLGVGGEELEYLRELGGDELRELRGQVVARLFDHQSLLVNLAAATRVLPAALTANLAEKAFGPMLAARIAGLVDADRAVDIASRLPEPFLADVAVELDPRRVAAILAAIPPETVAAVTRLLIAREEWVAMGSFLGYLPPASVAAAMGEADPRQLLAISLVLDDMSQLPAVIDVVGIETLEAIAAAAQADGLTAELWALAAYLTPEQRAQLPA